MEGEGAGGCSGETMQNFLEPGEAMGAENVQALRGRKDGAVGSALALHNTDLG